jgi:hypothetical protein
LLLSVAAPLKLLQGMHDVVNVVLEDMRMDVVYSTVEENNKSEVRCSD